MRRWLFLLMVVWIWAGAAAAAPDYGSGHSSSPRLVQAADRQISVGEAARIAQRAVGGRVLTADAATQGGRPVVRVKLLTAQGVVRVVIVDATTGQVH